MRLWLIFAFFMRDLSSHFAWEHVSNLDHQLEETHTFNRLTLHLQFHRRSSSKRDFDKLVLFWVFFTFLMRIPFNFFYLSWNKLNNSVKENFYQLEKYFLNFSTIGGHWRYFRRPTWGEDSILNYSTVTNYRFVFVN